MDMDMCKDTWLSDALTLIPPCVFFGIPPSLTFQSRRVVGVRTPFLTALLDALSSALSRACMSRSCDTALLSSVASSPRQEARRRARRRRSYNWLRLRTS